MATETVDKAPLHKEVEEFSDAERAEWLKSGKVPTLEQEEKESSSEADASAASKPASAAGGKESGSGPGKKERSDGRNWRALEAERDALKAKQEAAEKELEEYRSGKRKPEEKKDQPKLLEAPKRPPMKQFMSSDGVLDSDKYEAALDQYETDRAAYINQQTQIRTASAQQEQAVRTWTSELKGKYGDKADKVNVKATADKLAATLQSAPAFFMHLQSTSEELFPHVLYVLGTDPKLDELLAEAKDPKTAFAAIEKLVLIKDGIRREFAKPAKNGAGDEEFNEGDEGKPKGKQLTKAGKPPVEASGATSSPNDDGSADAAWRRKDLSPEERGELYRERRNAEERAKRKKKVN